MNDNTITIAGNLVADPELRYTPKGHAVANLRIASTARVERGGRWSDGDTTFATVVAWNTLAENVAESLTRGMRVVVVARLRQRDYETPEGEKRTVYELQADEVSPSLRMATAKVTKTTKGGGETQPAPAAEPAAEAA